MRRYLRPSFPKSLFKLKEGRKEVRRKGKRRQKKSFQLYGETEIKKDWQRIVSTPPPETILGMKSRTRGKKRCPEAGK